MFDYKKFEYKDSQYFETLPKSVKETIVQTGANFDSEEEFIDFVTKFENGIN